MYSTPSGPASTPRIVFLSNRIASSLPSRRSRRRPSHGPSRAGRRRPPPGSVLVAERDPEAGRQAHEAQPERVPAERRTRESRLQLLAFRSWAPGSRRPARGSCSRVPCLLPTRGRRWGNRQAYETPPCSGARELRSACHQPQKGGSYAIPGRRSIAVSRRSNTTQAARSSSPPPGRRRSRPGHVDTSSWLGRAARERPGRHARLRRARRRVLAARRPLRSRPLAGHVGGLAIVRPGFRP